MPAETPPAGKPLRLQAYLARAGVASRRASEALIDAGRVAVNGHTVTVQGSQVVPGRDRVTVDGEAVELAGAAWVAIHKPAGYVSTRSDTFGRQTVYDLIPAQFHSLFHVGRLDRDSEGLLLLTNEGGVANRLTHPRYGVEKEYLADVQGSPSAGALRQLREGVELDDGTARALRAERLHQVGDDVFRVRLVLQEGRKREVRRMFDAVGHPVRRLQRERFGPIGLGELPSGRWRVLSRVEVGSLRAAASTRGAGT